MKTLKFDDREEWLESRVGSVTGTSLSGVLSENTVLKENIVSALTELGIEHKKTAKKDELMALLPPNKIKELKKAAPKKIGFYDLIAQRIAIPEVGNEDPMERGHRLEQEALQKLGKALKTTVSNDLIVWVSGDDDNIRISPDGVIDSSTAAEAKCLSSARHLEAYFTRKVPTEHWEQMVHYFIVNPKLKKLYVTFYDPRIPSAEFFYIEVNREDVQETVDEYKKQLKETLEEINELVLKLTF